MKYNINEHARAFLAEHLREGLDAESSYAALRMLSGLIDEKGFDAPKYEKLNAFGLEADEVYDEIYELNMQ